MRPYQAVRPWARTVMALLVVIAITAQCQQLSDKGLFKPANVFSFFTIQSNILAAFTLLWLEFRRDSVMNRIAIAIRPAVVLYMSMTGIVYAVLLAPVSADVGLTAPWVDKVLHVVAPIVVVGDWFLDPPLRAPDVRDIPKWLVFPIAYLVYSLVRGSIADWYPYPFLDPRDGIEHGAGSAVAVAVTSAVIAVCVIGFAWVLVRITPKRKAASGEDAVV